MEINIDYKTFCGLYYKAAEEVADITVAEHIKGHGKLNPYIDVELAKDLGISYGLEKVYNNYDVDNEKHAKVKTFLSKVVRNCVLSELAKESTAVGAKKRPSECMDSMVLAATIGGAYATLGAFSGSIQTSGRFEKKEDLIAKMLSCLKTLSGVDQVILNCWMLYPKGDYIDRVLEELEWENNKRTRNVVSVRWGRAIEMLRKKMEGDRSVYRDIYSSPDMAKAPESAPVQKVQSDVDQNFVRRRQRAAKKSIAGGIDYKGLAMTLATSLPDQPTK